MYFRVCPHPCMDLYVPCDLTTCVLPGHTVTVILFPLVPWTAAVVHSGQLEGPAETVAVGTARPVVRLQTQTQRAGATLRSYRLSVIPGYPSVTGDATSEPSKHSWPPRCKKTPFMSQHIHQHN